MEAVGVGDRKIENGLVKDYLTPEMQKKLYRLITVTGSDPLLRAQDVSDYGIQSLTCRHLEGNGMKCLTCERRMTQLLSKFQ